jgi:NAD(P)-dependent dehydrogenase (short-subunit alcohol dehydrogenase family)
MAARDAAAGAEAAEALRAEGLDVRAEVLDVADETSVLGCAERLRAADVPVAVLVNNAAVFPPGDVLGTSPDVWREVLSINLFGALWTTRAFVPDMLRRGYGRVVNVSSGYGSFGEGMTGPAAYGVSKAALNALTLHLAHEVRGDVKVNTVCPGWVKTRMGGPGAPREVEDAAADLVWAATLPSDGPSGGFFRYRKPLHW